jgi:hypothetical protein
LATGWPVSIDVQAFDITLEFGRDGIGAALVRLDAAGGADDLVQRAQLAASVLTPSFCTFSVLILI